jgi:hypothetical protein
MEILTATVETKETHRGLLYTVTLSDGTVATRNSTKPKAAMWLKATGTVQTGFTTRLSANAAGLVKQAQTIYPRPGDVVVCLATGTVLYHHRAEGVA